MLNVQFHKVPKRTKSKINNKGLQKSKLKTVNVGVYKTTEATIKNNILVFIKCQKSVKKTG